MKHMTFHLYVWVQHGCFLMCGPSYGHRWTRSTGWPVFRAVGGPVGHGGLQPYVYLQHVGPLWVDQDVGPSLVDQVAGAQVGQVYLGDLCLWLQVDLQPYLYGGAAWWAPPHGWALLRGTGGPG